MQNSGPMYKKRWFWIFVVFAIAGVMNTKNGRQGGDSSTGSSEVSSSEDVLRVERGVAMSSLLVLHTSYSIKTAKQSFRA
jgi:hypothetical protein